MIICLRSINNIVSMILSDCLALFGCDTGV